jgi:hypothetical protein
LDRRDNSIASIPSPNLITSMAANGVDTMVYFVTYSAGKIINLNREMGDIKPHLSSSVQDCFSRDFHEINL